MNRGTSLYLDLVRLMAAFVVFLDHYSMRGLSGGLFYQLAPFGAEAVTVFFVLSGYVIGYAVDTREKSAREYLINRAARIYSVALPALVLTFLLDLVGRSLKPDLYLSMPDFRPEGEFWQYVRGLLFINQIWWLRSVPGSNLPYWSLGFEVWYYAVFAVVAFAHGRWRILGTMALLLIAGPKIVAMLPLWLLGLLVYRVNSRHPLASWVSVLLFHGSLLAWLGYEAWVWKHGRLFDLAPGFLQRQQFVQDYVIGGLFAANLMGVSAIAPAFSRLPQRMANSIRWAAGATFSLYLFHLPLMLALTALMPWGPQAAVTRLVLFFGTLASVFALAEVTERRKNVWRRLFASMLPQASRL